MRNIVYLFTSGILIFLLHTKLINAQEGIGPDGNPIFPLKLSYFFPDYENFKGKIRYFEWKEFRRIDDQYLMPDIQKWVSTLKRTKKPDLHQKHIKIWFKNKNVRYFYVQDDTSSFRNFYGVNGDTIEVALVDGENILYMLNQYGVGFLRYFYKDGRLRAVKTYSGMPNIREKLDLSHRLRSVTNYLFSDEDRGVYFDSTEFKDKLDFIDFRTRLINKKVFENSLIR